MKSKIRTKLLRVIKSIEALQQSEVETFVDSEIDRQIYWQQVEGMLLMFKNAAYHTKPEVIKKAMA